MARTRQSARLSTGGSAKRVVLVETTSAPPADSDINMVEPLEEEPAQPLNLQVSTYHVMDHSKMQ
jgi:hypothetical protein